MLGLIMLLLAVRFYRKGRHAEAEASERVGTVVFAGAVLIVLLVLLPLRINAAANAAGAGATVVACETLGNESCCGPRAAHEQASAEAVVDGIDTLIWVVAAL